jgi:hypothetical protein
VGQARGCACRALRSPCLERVQVAQVITESGFNGFSRRFPATTRSDLSRRSDRIHTQSCPTLRQRDPSLRYAISMSHSQTSHGTGTPTLLVDVQLFKRPSVHGQVRLRESKSIVNELATIQLRTARSWKNRFWEGAS